MHFKKTLDDSKRKSSKTWKEKGSEFYKASMKSWLEKSDIAKDLLEPWKIKFINTWLQYQEMCILIN